MADHANTTRRHFLKALGFAAAGTAVSTVAVAEVAKPVFVKVGSPTLPGSRGPAADADLVAIPREAYDAIKAWQTAQRESVAAANAFSDYSRPIGLRIHAGGYKATPEEKAMGDELFQRHVETSQEVGPAREKMIFALLRV